MPGRVDDSSATVDRELDRAQSRESTRRCYRVGDLEDKNVHVALIKRHTIYAAPFTSNARCIITKGANDASEHRAMPIIVDNRAASGRDDANSLDRRREWNYRRREWNYGWDQREILMALHYAG